MSGHSRPSARVGATLTLGLCLWGCTSEAERRCQGDLQAYDGVAKTRMVTLQDGDVGPIQAQIIVPWVSARYAEGAPAAVFAHGSWSTNHVPLEKDSSRILTGQGVASVYFNLPGGQGDQASAGENDRRGPEARAALALVLRYAAGEVADTQDCTLSDRVPEGTSGDLVLAAFSNGGNLAWATLADDSLDLPELIGVASFETPSAGQFVVVEPGSVSRVSPLYEEGSCRLDDNNAIVCDFDYSDLSWDGLASPATDGQLFVDVDGDGRFTDEVDFPLGSVWDPVTEAWTQSLPATEAASSAGVLPPNRVSPESAATFWETREAPRAMGAAVARFPDLASIEVGTEVDHVLQGATDHPHVTGMIAAMAEAGVPWRRLNPDSSYARAVVGLSGSSWEFVELPANTEVSVGDPDAPMEPAPEGEVGSNHYITAAVVELLDRGHWGVWDADLDEAIPND